LPPYRARNRRSVGDSEEVSRFIFSDGHYARTKGLVKPRAFDDRELSIAFAAGLGPELLWRLGDRIGRPRKKLAKARAQLLAGEVRSLDLDPIVSEPPRFHGLINRWPTDDLERTKNLAQRLAGLARLEVRDSGDETS
jgi:hypothetical protein